MHTIEIKTSNQGESWIIPVIAYGDYAVLTVSTDFMRSPSRFPDTYAVTLRNATTLKTVTSSNLRHARALLEVIDTFYHTYFLSYKDFNLHCVDPGIVKALRETLEDYVTSKRINCRIGVSTFKY
jgi:hypothetical protein